LLAKPRNAVILRRRSRIRKPLYLLLGRRRGEDGDVVFSPARVLVYVRNGDAAGRTGVPGALPASGRRSDVGATATRKGWKGCVSSRGAGSDANIFHKMEDGHSASFALALRAGAGAPDSPVGLSHCV
jgi:hypothetical protein